MKVKSKGKKSAKKHVGNEESSSGFPPATRNSYVGEVSKLVSDDEVLVGVRVNDAVLQASLSHRLASDSLDAPFSSMSSFKLGVEVDNLTPLSTTKTGEHRVIRKPFISKLLEDSNISVPTKIEEVVKDQLVAAIITKVVIRNRYSLELIGGSGIEAFALPGDVDEGEHNRFPLELGQSVVGRVISVEDGAVRLTLKPGFCIPSRQDPIALALKLTQVYVAEQIELAEQHKLPAPGTIVKATVKQVVEHCLTLTFGDNNSIGGIARGVFDSSAVELGKPVSAVVLCYQYPSKQAELAVIDPTSAGQEPRKGACIKGTVVTTHRDFIVVLSEKQNIHYLPGRLHPNIVPLKHGRLPKVSTIKVFPKLKVGDLSISVHTKDENRAHQMVNSAVSHAVVPVSDTPEAVPAEENGDIDDDIEVEVGTDENGVDMSSKAKRKRGVAVGKVFSDAQIEGRWQSKDPSDKGTIAVVVRLPTGHTARLHACEFGQNAKGIQDFIDEHKNKPLPVIVLSSNKGHIDVSAEPEKVEDQSVIRFRKVFKSGSRVPVFAKSFDSKGVTFEINPLFNAICFKEKLPKEFKIDEAVETGARYLAQVLCVRGSLIEVIPLPERKPKSLKDKDATKATPEQIKHPLFGRLFYDVKVVGQWTVKDEEKKGTLAAELKLPTGAAARLHASELPNGVKTIQQFLEEYSGKKVTVMVIGCNNDVVEVSVKPQKLESQMALRYRQFFTKGHTVPVFAREVGEKGITFEVNPLYDAFCAREKLPKDWAETGAVEIGARHFAQVTEVHDDILHVIPLPIRRKRTSSRLSETVSEKTERDMQEALATCVNDAVVDEEDDEEAMDVTKSVPLPNSTLEQERKRNSNSASSQEHLPKKKKAKLDKKTTVQIDEEDPGWDFSNEGFRPQDLARVAKLVKGEEVTLVKKTKEKKKDAIVEEEVEKTKDERTVEREKELLALESRLIEGQNPETDEEFSILIKRNPNSAEMWIRYMTYFLGKNELDTARKTAERALQTINYLEDEQRLAMWCAYLNMEITFGSYTSAKQVFDRACPNTDAYKVHKQFAMLLSKGDKNDEADEIYDQMIRRFRAGNDEVWILYARHLMATGRQEPARDLLKRAMQSAQKQRHLMLISQFACLEYQMGDAERGRTLFEGIVSNFPKKTDTWHVYIDQSIKHSSPDVVRQLFERVCSMPMSMYNIRPFYRKWLAFEEKHGDEKSQDEVRQRAERYLRELQEDIAVDNK